MKKMVGRILGLALCLGALLGALCLSASAEGEQHTAHYSCGEADCENEKHEHIEVTEWTPWNGTDPIPYDTDTKTAYVYLTSNVTWDSLPQYTYFCLNVAENYTLYLCLNGHNLTAQYTDAQQIIYVSGTLILSDCRGTGTIAHGTGEDMLGVGVKVTSGGTFKMYGGTISGNRSVYGGGVVIDNGTFKMYGGTISDNESKGSNDTHYGGGVHVRGTNGTFEMYSGTITRNNASGTCSGGGVGISGSSRFIMHDGNITNNEAASTGSVNGGGGGVYVTGYGTFEMENGTISGNTTDKNGGGVYVGSGTFQMKHGTISNNKAAGSNSSIPGGGGVYVAGGTFEMTNDSTISGNQALNGSGGGVYFRGGSYSSYSLTISGSAKIENNLAAGSGGVYVDGVTFKVSGDISITGNKGGCTLNTASGNLTGGSDSNVYLTYHAEAPRYITVMGALTNRIQVTTEKTPDSSSCVKIATATSASSANALAKLDYTNKTTDDKAIPLIAIENTNGGVDIFACIHNWSENWTTDETDHWHECSICNGKDEEIAHTYTAQEKNGAALKTAGTCTSEAVYYYSCSACGRVEKNDDHTFKGDLDSSNHAGTESWVQTATTHEKKWDCCDKVTVTSEDHAWNDGVCTMCSYTCKHPDAKDNGDCTKAVVCDVCGETVTAAESDHDWSEWSSNKNGTHTRSCKRANCEKTETKNCSGGTATCTKKAVCTTCKAEYGDLAAHDYTAETKSDSTLKTPGTCISKAVYYYSCSVCGDVEKNDNHTFEGDLDSSNHAKSLSDWHSDGNRHWKEYLCCKVRTDEGTCSGGTATCTEKAVCTTCNTPYGEKDPDNHDWSPEWTSDENRHWHMCTRNGCGATKDAAEHTYSSKITKQPTCTEAGEKTFTCTDCGRVKTERIDAKGHSYGQDWERDATHHWHKCANCDATDSYTEHSGDTATCTEKAVCKVCNTSYGKENPANHSGTLGEDWYSDDSQHWKKYSCCDADGDKSDHTWDGGVISTDPTCTASGEKTYTCTECSETKTEAVSALGHDWGEWTVTTPATADAEGVETRICGNNGSHRQTRAIPKITAATCPKDASCPLADFSDLVPTAWYHDGVHYCLENGLMQGFAGGLFLPEGSTTRGQLAAILWRLEGCPAAEGGTDFTDVGPDSWCAAAVRWASSVDVVLGFGDGRFAPDAAVTREQTAAILWRYAAYKGWDLSAGTDLAAFSDAADVSSYAVPAMQWACGSGLLIGDGAALLPQGTALRVQTAAMMQRFCTAFSALSAQA